MERYIQSLLTDGFCHIPQAVDSTHVEKAYDLVLEWHCRMEGNLSDKVPFLDRGQKVLYNLQNKDLFFLRLMTASPVIEPILRAALNDPWYRQIPQDQPNYILRSYGARSGTNALPLHIDSFMPYGGPHLLGVQAAIILDKQTVANGCTIVVPGSHQNAAYADASALPQAIPIESEPGDVVIWDSRLWHGTTENVTDAPRWSLIATFTRWWIKQHFDITRNLPEHIYEALSVQEKAILGFCSLPWDTEEDGIDLKCGYSELLPHVSDYRFGQPLNERHSAQSKPATIHA